LRCADEGLVRGWARRADWRNCQQEHAGKRPGRAAAATPGRDGRSRGSPEASYIAGALEHGLQTNG
jgi:hypothetical protein